MKKITIYGLPVSPNKLIEELAGKSFCVSYGTRARLGRQLDDAIRLVGKDGILLVDNGAFTHWRKTGGKIDIEGFAAWANDITERCPEAVVVLPDVIDGTADENCALVYKTFAMLDACDRAMPVWHLHEPIAHLRHLLDTGFNFIAFGSSGEFKDPGTAKWNARIREALAAVDAYEAEGNERPRIHMMRALSKAHLYEFDSADSTNLARNSHRYKKEGAGYVARFAKRIAAPIEASPTTHELRPLDSLHACTEEFAAAKLRELGFEVGYASDNDNEDLFTHRRAA